MECDLNGVCYRLTRSQQHVDPSTPWWVWALIALGGLVVLIFVFSSIKVVEQYERGVIYRRGRIIGTKEPGFAFVLPFLDYIEKVDMRVTSLPLETQQVITKDSVSLTVNAVVFYKVTDAVKSEVEVDGYEDAIQNYGQAVMRKHIGRHDLEDVLHTDQDVATQIQTELEHVTSAWGIEITNLELTDIELPESMRRAMAAKAEAQREAQAKLLAAEGELNSAQRLRQAADHLTPVALELRRLQVLREIADERSTIIVAPTGAGLTAAEAVAGVSTVKA